MKKRWIAVPLILVLIAGLICAGFAYYDFVTETIYAESIAHLTEIFHQANQALNNLVSTNWSQMRMWAPHLEHVESDEEMAEYVSLAREDSKFTDFFFISRNGNYITLEGKRGYLDLRDKLSSLILDGEPVVINSVVPDQPEIMVFAVPAARSTYRGFEYEAIAISFNNSDLVETLRISAFGGRASTFAILPDGRVVVNNASEELQDVHNVLALLEQSENFDDAALAELQRDFLAGKSGALLFRVEGQPYYLVYESAGFQDWTVLGIVATDVVNASMSRLQSTTITVVSAIAISLTVMVLLFVVQQNRLKLKRKDNELLSRDALFSRLSRNVDDVFLMMDAQNLQVDYVSANTERLLGLSEQQVREDIHIIETVVRGEDTGLVLDHLSSILPGQQKEWDREYIHQKTGEVRWFHVIAFCSDIQGEKKYILDLSDRTNDKRTNLALEDAVRTAENASRAKSAFLSNMSHDIRTPMNAVIGFTILAKANIDRRDRLGGYLDKILASSNHLLSLINDVLDMSRIESGKIHLEETEVNLSEVMHDLKTIIGGQIHAKNLRLVMDARSVTDEDVYCDRTRLNQVLLNLLSNAIKFTPEGGRIDVRLVQLSDAQQGMGRYALQVKDSGIGMTEEFARRIFEPFERERTSTVSRIQGTGLGMAITKSIVDLMGGTIDVRTEQGRGTEFVIRFSLRLQKHNMEPVEELAGKRVLVAAKDGTAFERVCGMLRRLGMRPEQAQSGEDALRCIREAVEMGAPFHACVVDMELADMDGTELIRQLAGLNRRPIIVCTADDGLEYEDAAFAAGADACCESPLFLSDLRRALCAGEQRTNGESALSAVDADAGFAGKRLLLVEDNELNREIALEILEEYGFAMDTAENGAIAVEKVAASKPGDYDLILMDIQMPVMDGYAATRRIRALENRRLAEIPILAMTANAFEEDRREAEENGMDGFLSKPIQMDKLVETLRSVLNG